MLDNSVSCSIFFKRVSDYKVTKLGVRSNHVAIMTQFRLMVIKFNNERNDIMIIDWNKIQTDEEENEIFNTKLFELTLSTDTSALLYTEFNSNILRAG